MSVAGNRSADPLSGPNAPPELRLGLIDPRTLMRDAVRSLLQNWRPLKEPTGTLVVLPFGDVSEFTTYYPDPGAHFDVVALNIGAAPLSEDSIRNEVESLRDHLSGLPLVVMSDACQPQALGLLRQKGIKGYIPAMLTPAVVIEAVRLVWAGGVFIPSDLLNYTGDGAPRSQEHDCMTVPKELTRRETAVLNLLRRGTSNKRIASELGISENTVKAYVRRIMRKFGAVNRTHACYLVQRASDAAARVSRELAALATPS